MIEDVHRIREEARGKIGGAESLHDLDTLRVHYLGKKGLVTGLLHQLREIDPTRRRELGALVNQIKSDLETEIDHRKTQIQSIAIERELTSGPALDVTLPGQTLLTPGSLHPITRVLEQMIECLKRVGFSLAFGPEVETEFYNFEALGLPVDHPARDMQATFFIKESVLLRTHTSPVQIRAMSSKKPPLQIIAVGKVYRADYDVTHTPMFHQMEGLLVDKNISLADLKGILHMLVKGLFGTRPLRFRPSYFPFTEPSAEVDMQCIQCKGSGRDCRICGSTGWLEIGGCGMVHPNVFRAVNYDPEETTGFAFGMGVERIAMLKYEIDDLRSLFENDYRMLEQF